MKVSRLLMLGVVVLLLACSEDEAVLPTSEGMIGTWAVTAITYNGTTSTNLGGITSKASFTGKGKDMDYTTNFSSDPNSVSSQGSYTIELKTTVYGQTTTEDYEMNEGLMDGTWELNGKTLTITSGDITQEGTVTKQTDTVLEVKIDYTETTTDAGIKITVKVKAVYKFQKINI